MGMGVAPQLLTQALRNLTKTVGGLKEALAPTQLAQMNWATLNLLKPRLGKSLTGSHTGITNAIVAPGPRGARHEMYPHNSEYDYICDQVKIFLSSLAPATTLSDKIIKKKGSGMVSIQLGPQSNPEP